MVGARTFLTDYLFRRLRSPCLGPGLHPAGDRLMIREEVVAVVGAVMAYATTEKRLPQRRVQQPHVNVPVVRLQHRGGVELPGGFQDDHSRERLLSIGEVVKRPALALEAHERENLIASRPWQVLADLCGRAEQ